MRKNNRMTWSLLSLATFAIAMMPMAFAQQPNQVGAAGTASTLAINPDTQRAQGARGLPNGPLTAVPEDFASLKLAPGFLLNIEVYDEPELSTQARIDGQGNLSLPLLGSIHLAGLTITDAEQNLEAQFRKKQILTNPQVTLNIEQYASASVTVLGEVQAPGRIQLLAPHSLRDVIGMAGGQTNLAGDSVRVQHTGENGTTSTVYRDPAGSKGNTIRDVQVQPGDTVTVLRAGIVYVLGAVNRPGGYVMQENGTLNVAQALSLAWGTSMQAKIGGLRVVRHEPDGTLKEIPLSYKGITSGKVKPLQLEAEDIVYVPVSKIKAVFSSGASIVGETASAAIFVVH